MNKIRYILDLTGITLPAGVKEAAEKKINGADTVYEKKRGRRTAVIAAAVIAAFILLSVAVSLIIKNANKPTDPPYPDTTSSDMTGSDTVSGTDAQPSDPYDEDGYYSFSPLYENDVRYDAFKTATQVFKPCDGYIVAAEDVSPLYKYFGAGSTEYLLSRNDLCRTFYAFYSENTIRSSISITENSPESLVRIKEEMKKNEKMKADHDLYPDEIILLAARDGTFEYLLTMSVLTDRGPNGSTERGTQLFDDSPEPIGSYGLHGYTVKRSAFEKAGFSIYKIRFEMGVPVIYEKYDLPPVTFAGPDVYLKSKDGSTLSFPVNCLAAEDESEDTKRIVYGSFQIRNSIIELTPKENAMLDPAVGTASPRTVSSELCNYPYSFPCADADTAGCSRQDVCNIINQLDLQWFFPMYINDTGTGTIIVGEGIKYGSNNRAITSAVSSVSLRTIKTANGSDIYKTYYGYGGSASVMNGENVSLLYLPETCDKPYFDATYFEKDHPLIKLYLTEDGYVMDDVLTKDDFENEMQSHTAPVEFTPISTSEYVYIKDPYYKYFPARPYHSGLVPFVGEELKETPELFEKLGLSVKPCDKINGFDVTLGRREINITEIRNEPILYEEERYGVVGAEYYLVCAYEDKNGYIIDMSGCVYGITADKGVYLFSSCTPNNLIIVCAEDGFVTYSYFGFDGNYDGTVNYSVSYDKSFDISPETAAYIVERRGVSAVMLEITSQIKDEETGDLTVTVKSAIVPGAVVLPLKWKFENKSWYVVTYGENRRMFIRDGRIIYNYGEDYYSGGYTSVTFKIIGGSVKEASVYTYVSG